MNMNKKMATLDLILLIMFIVWASALDFRHLTMIEEVGLGATAVYAIMLAVKAIQIKIEKKAKNN